MMTIITLTLHYLHPISGITGMCDLCLVLLGAENATQGSMHARQVLCKWSHIHSPKCSIPKDNVQIQGRKDMRVSRAMKLLFGTTQVDTLHYTFIQIQTTNT